MSKKRWMQSVNKEIQKEGTEGVFRKEAQRHGMSTEEYARKVLNDPESTTLKKRRANLALNFIRASRKRKK